MKSKLLALGSVVVAVGLTPFTARSQSVGLSVQTPFQSLCQGSCPASSPLPMGLTGSTAFPTTTFTVNGDQFSVSGNTLGQNSPTGNTSLNTIFSITALNGTMHVDTLTLDAFAAYLSTAGSYTFAAGTNTNFPPGP